jgi:hypothetical protein
MFDGHGLSWPITHILEICRWSIPFIRFGVAKASRFGYALRQRFTLDVQMATPAPDNKLRAVPMAQ